MGFDASYAKGKGEGLTDNTSHRGTEVVGLEEVTMTSGRDTTIIGSKVKGEKVKAQVGRNLMVESLQDSENYHQDKKSLGLSISMSKPSIDTASFSYIKGKTASTYASVKEQAGIYGGKEGFDVTVGEKTHLKGAVISSTADKEKNSLTTGNLVMEDIQNKAEYSMSSKGVAYNKVSNFNELSENQQNKLYNKLGLTPTMSPRVSDTAASTTYAAIADGYLDIKDKRMSEKTIRRDTENSLHALGQLFDKKKVEERQELVTMFSKHANEAIHRLSDKYHWKEGSKEKIALHTFVGGITSKLADNALGEGAFSAGINEAMMPTLVKAAGTMEDGTTTSPDKLRWISAVLGYATNKTLGGSGDMGTFTAHMGSKHNLLHLLFRPAIESLDLSQLKNNQVYVITTASGAKGLNGEIGVVVDKYGKIYDTISAGGSYDSSVIPVSATVKIQTFAFIDENDSDVEGKILSSVMGIDISGGVILDHLYWGAGLGVPQRISFEEFQNTLHYDVGFSSSQWGINMSAGNTIYVGSLYDSKI